jgi:hypothetical protein
VEYFPFYPRALEVVRAVSYELYRAWSGLRRSQEVQDRVTLREKQGGSPS